jgi:hypothetical protein
MCGWTSSDKDALTPAKPSGRKRLPAWGLLVAVLLPALLTAATARAQGAAIGLALIGSALAGLYAAVWLWMRMEKNPVAKVLLGGIAGLCCGFVALTLSAFGCAMGGFKMDFR